MTITLLKLMLSPNASGHHGWIHWFNYPLADGGRPNVDLWPDVSEYSPSELFPVPGLKLENGEQAFLFSSRHPKTVRRYYILLILLTSHSILSETELTSQTL